MKERIRSLHENRIFALIIWLIAIFAAIVLMQNTTSLIQQKGQPQLANDSQPVVAQSIQRDWGRDVGNTYNVTAVFNKASGQIGSTEQAAIDSTISKLQSHQKFYGIKAIQTLATNPTAQDQFLSADKSTEIVQLSIDRNQGEIRVIANQLQGQLSTTGLDSYVTSPEIVNDVANQKNQSSDDGRNGHSLYFSTHHYGDFVQIPRCTNYQYAGHFNGLRRVFKHC
ncbi:hypothetical protein [Secundilactobacillus kimchicus]|uniref:hypothetical protein n=1 Tax=Secundilactobacillus kimchicus TaxID=528209 RepID=UPI0006D0C8B6|nr:hypothetical protein [Secundilactobacillus kimchicus]